MGLLDRLKDALAGDRLTVAVDPRRFPAGDAEPGSSLAEPGATSEPKETLLLFIHRTNALSDAQWRDIQRTWEAMRADPEHTVALAAAEQHAEQLGLQQHRRVEVMSEVHVEFADEKSRLVTMASPALRRRMETLQANLRERSAIQRDALLALSVRDVLPREQFDLLYAPFQPFVPRGELERDATDWASAGVPAPSGASQPASATEPAGGQPSRDAAVGPASAVPSPGSPDDPVRQAGAPAAPLESDPWRDLPGGWGPPEG